MKGKGFDSIEGGMVIVTNESHPHVFAALREIDLDNGAINRLEPAQDWYECPDPFAAWVPEAEQGLAGLSSEDRDTFCSGEFGEIEDMVAAQPKLLAAFNLLNCYFNGWED